MTRGGRRAGAGRKNAHDGRPLVTTSVNIPKDLRDWADETAARVGLNRSILVARAIETLRRMSGDEIRETLNRGQQQAANTNERG